MFLSSHLQVGGRVQTAVNIYSLIYQISSDQQRSTDFEIYRIEAGDHHNTPPQSNLEHDNNGDVQGAWIVICNWEM